MPELLSEAADKSFVVWFDTNGDPYAVFRRADHHANGWDGMGRWINVDQFDSDSDDVPWTWDELGKEMAELDGPHLLTLVRRSEVAL